MQSLLPLKRCNELCQTLKFLSRASVNKTYRMSGLFEIYLFNFPNFKPAVFCFFTKTSVLTES